MGAIPSYVPKDFAGKCRCFPTPAADGREPVLIDYQRKWVLDKSLSKLMEKSRRVGVTYATAYERVEAHSLRDRSLDSWISSRDEPTARLFIREALKFARILHIGAKDLGQQVIGDGGDKAHVLEFANNTIINSLSGNPDAFAGKGGDVLLDELALRKDPRTVYGIAAPTIDWGGALAAISTHRGSANYFNTLVREIREEGNPKGWSLHRVTLQDALEQGLLYKLQRHYRPGDPRLLLDEAAYFDFQRKRCADEETFLQEYCCVPGDDAAAFLSYELLDACKYAAADAREWGIVRIENGTVQSTAGGTCPMSPADVAAMVKLRGEGFAGLDIARHGDLSVIQVNDKVGGVHFTRLVIEMHGTPYHVQEAWLDAVMLIPGLRRLCGDRTGSGDQMMERAKRRHGAARVEPVLFTTRTKEELAFPVRGACEDRAVRLPADDKYTADLRAVKKEVVAGNIRFSADRGENGHADRFWSLALALAAGKDPAGQYAVINIE